MRTIRIQLIAALTSVLALAACSDGSVRSPDLIGSGELLEAELQCRAPGETGFSDCTGTRNIVAGQAIDYRVLGSFEDGSQLVATSRFRFSVSDTSRARLEGDASDGVQTVRALQETEAGSPITVFANDPDEEVETLSSALTIEGGVPQSIDITLDGNDLRVVSGVPTQLFARITFNAGQPEEITVPNDQDARAPGNIDWEIVTDPEGTSEIGNDGVLIGRNPSIEEELDLTVRVTLTPRQDGPQFEGPITADRTVTVEPAQYIEGSFRIRFLRDENIVPVDTTRELQALATFQGVADPETGETVTREFDVTRDIDPGFSVADPAIGEIVPGEDQPDDTEVPNTFSALATGVTTVSAGFRGDEDSVEVRVVQAGIGQLRLLPVTGEDAELLGLTTDGRLPCEADPVTCPDDSLAPPDDGMGALEPGRTLPGLAIAYQVFAVLEGREDIPTDELEPGELFLLDDTVECGPSPILPVRVTAEDPDTVAVSPVETASGEQAYEIEGLAEGSAALQARLGRGPAADNGINCAGRDVADAGQQVEVGFPEASSETASLRTKAGGPVSAVSLETSTASACVGYADASSALTDPDSDGRGRESLRVTAIYEDAEGDILRIPVNQQRRIDFSAQYGTRDDEGRMCDGPLTAETLPTEDLPEEAQAFFEANSPVAVSNARNVRRGIIQSQSPVSLGTACVRTNFDLSGVRIGEPEQEDRSVSVTITALPIVDDSIISGQSLLTGNEIDGFCEPLLPVLDLLPGADENLAIDLINVLGASGGLLLNSDEANELGNEGGTALLDALSLVPEMLLGPTGLDEVLSSLFGILGIGGGNDELTGGGLLVTLLDGLSTAVQEGAGQLPDDFSFEDLLEELENAQP